MHTMPNVITSAGHQRSIHGLFSCDIVVLLPLLIEILHRGYTSSE